MMPKAVNRDFTQDTILRISPTRNALIVEEQKKDGSMTYKEISPIDVYYVLNESYVNKGLLSSGFLPENCLHVSLGAAEKNYVIWNSELRANMSFGEVEYPDFPIPRMVFGVRMLDNGKVAECSVGVVADGRPTPETIMYHYPFANLYEDGKMCTGNNLLPRYKKIDSMRFLPRFLLELPETDEMFCSDNNKLMLPQKDLMEHLKDKEPAYYYTDILIPNGKTLSDFIVGR